MSGALTIRRQIEAALAERIPSALTPQPRTIRPVEATGIPKIDELLQGGLPLGAITEIVGPECSGRTAFALSFIAGMTRTAKVCAWIDVTNAFDPESAAAAGVDLSRLLWVRCGAQHSNAPIPSEHTFSLPEKYLVPRSTIKGLHGGCGGHPRSETKGLSDAVSGLLHPEALAPQYAEPQRRKRPKRQVIEAAVSFPALNDDRKRDPVAKPWARIEQALRVTDLLLQAGGFSAIVLDVSGVAGEYVSRVPLATWFRYRSAAERTHASILLLTQVSCAKSSAELLLHLQPGKASRDEATVFTGAEHRIEVARRRFMNTSANVIPLRKPPQSVTTADWRSCTTWAGAR